MEALNTGAAPRNKPALHTTQRRVKSWLGDLGLDYRVKGRGVAHPKMKIETKCNHKKIIKGQEKKKKRTI